MQPHPPKRWLRIVVTTFYVFIPLTMTALAAIPEDPYLLPSQAWARSQAEYVEIEEYVEFFEYVEIDEDQGPYSPDGEIELVTLDYTIDTTTTVPPSESVEAASESDAEPESEPGPVEEPVVESVSEQPATPEPEPPSQSSGVEQWRGLVTAYFPASEVEYALCIMAHESGGDPGATNPRSGAAGLFQFIPSTWNGMVPDEITGGTHESVYVAETNVRGAAWLLEAAGWSQWTPHNRGAC